LLFEIGAAIEDDGERFAGRYIDKRRDVGSCRIDIRRQVCQGVGDAPARDAEVVRDDTHLEDDGQPVAVQHLHRTAGDIHAFQVL